MLVFQLSLFEAENIVTIFYIRKKYEVWDGKRFTALDSCAKKFISRKEAEKEIKLLIAPSLAAKNLRKLEIRTQTINLLEE